MKRLALCIGNQDYEFLPKLNCAVADAVSMEEVLKELGFDTMIGTDLNREDMANKIFEFQDKITDYDAILIYYAGHGFQVENDNILAPVDLNVNARPGMVAYNAFPLQKLLEVMSDNPEQTKIVILDACRENLGYRGTFNTFAPISAPRGSIVAYSTSPGKYSRENDATGHGKYTEALLKYIALPRVEIETVFKKVRENLTFDTDGTQVPWEHTSLIGSFYLNPDTIYDGASYVQESIEDSRFRFSTGSSVRAIVEGLKSRQWYTQEEAIKKVPGIEMSNVSINELFVLGRNIYQAAEGNCYACQRFIDGFEGNTRIADEAKVHILNGMAFEIYYDSEGKLRTQMKTGYYQKVIYCLERPAFYSSREFISSYLCKVEERPIYIPGQNEIMYLHISTAYNGEEYEIKEIQYQGKNILKWNAEWDTFPASPRRRSFEESIAKKLVAPLDVIRFQYDNDEIKNETHLVLESGEFQLVL